VTIVKRDDHVRVLATGEHRMSGPYGVPGRCDASNNDFRAL